MADRVCCTCKVTKDLSLFYRSVVQPGGRHTQCKVCADLGTRRRKLKKVFNMTEVDYVKRFKEQNGLCAICRSLDTSGIRLAVDHDHKTGKVRGLLCQQCNKGLGMFKDDIGLLNIATAYLEGLRSFQ